MNNIWIKNSVFPWTQKNSSCFSYRYNLSISGFVTNSVLRLFFFSVLLFFFGLDLKHGQYSQKICILAATLRGSILDSHD